ncbi:hypothetical protein LIA77_06583 [Sarocladium implicatum]|nr:hypothetical protein LIA77_06583 [Sarocladium implicatum]
MHGWAGGVPVSSDCMFGRSRTSRGTFSRSAIFLCLKLFTLSSNANGQLPGLASVETHGTFALPFLVLLGGG